MLLILGTLLIIGWIAAVTKTKWFPYPVSWLKALGLAIPTWFGSVAGFSLAVWVSAYSSVFVVSLDASLETSSSLLVLSAVCLVVSLV